MDALWQDIRYALRTLRRNPGFTAVAILTLALGIGANTAVFSLVNGVMLRPLPFPDADQLVRVYETNLARGWDSFSTSQPNYLDWRDQNRSFSQLAAVSSSPFNLTGSGEPERVSGATVTTQFLPALGVQPLLGRNILPEEDTPGGNNRVVLLSHGLWQRRFGADTRIVNQTIALNDESYTVVGVLPAAFRWGQAELFVPLVPDPRQSRGDHRLFVVGRLKAGISLEQAAADMTALAERLTRQYPQTNEGWGTRLGTFYNEMVPENLRRALLIFQGVVGLVLVIACANVANLLIARSTARRKEMAIRLALGAGRAGLSRQVLTESILVALLGGGLGVLLALWGLDALRAVNPGNIPRMDEVSVDMRVLGFSLAVSLLTGVLFGIVPALQSARADVNETLKEGGRGGDTSAARHRARNLLVVAEVAISLVLLIGGGLLLRSFWRLQNVPTGFQPDGLVTAQLTLPGSRYGEAPKFIAFYDALMERLPMSPQITEASFTNIVPMGGGNTAMEIVLDRRASEPGAAAPSAGWRLVGPGYFRTMGIPLLRGRELTAQDATPNRWGVVISQEMARRCWPNEDPIGKQFRPWSASNAPATVVGVTGDVRTLGVSLEPGPVVYLPFQLGVWNPITLVVRTSGDTAAGAVALREAVRSLDPNLPLAVVRTMEDIVDANLSGARFSMQLLMLFSSVALLLAAVGLFGVMAYLVTQRTHEIGIRMALGARPADILRMMVGRGLTLAGVGAAIGLAAAFALTRVMASMLYGVKATDPLTFAGTTLLLLTVAALACWFPARRAMRTDPMVALRYE